MIICNSKNFIFIHLEKCGGTSVESALEPYLCDDDILMGSTYDGEKRQTLLYKQHGMRKVKSEMVWKHSDAARIYRYVGKENWKRYKKFAVVRNPADLMESLYFFAELVIKLHMKNNINVEEWNTRLLTKNFPDNWPQCEPYVWAYIKSYIEKSGFDGFVSYMIREDFECVRPQINRLRPTFFEHNIGTIIDLSKLNKKWLSMTNEMGFENEVVPLEKLNQSIRTEPVEMSSKVYKLFRTHFAKDYEQLPYFTGVCWE